MTMQFWISQGREKLRLPVNPPTLAVNSPYLTETIEIDQLGEINVLKFSGVTEISFESFFPLNYSPSYCLYKNFHTPQYFIDTIEKWRATRKPVRFTVTETEINLLVIIPEFITEDRAGHNGDKFFSIVMNEYKDYKVKKISTKTTTTTTKKKTSSRTKSTITKKKTYTVKKNDTLWKIAARKDVYGNGSKYMTIYNANKKVIGKNPNKLQVGMKLIIP